MVLIAAKIAGNSGGSPPPGSVTLGDLAPLAAFSCIGNETASSATPAAVKMMGMPGQTSTATAAGTSTLTSLSKGQQIFTGVLTQTVTLPAVSTLPVLGFGYWIINDSTGALTVNSSGASLVITIAAGGRALVFCQLLTGTTAASWNTVSIPTGLALITQTITNGDTTHAPSGDAVFDALAAKAPSTGIDAASIADGSVSNTEFQYINSLSSNAQDQINTNAGEVTDKVSKDVTLYDPLVSERNALAYVWNTDDGAPQRTALSFGTYTPTASAATNLDSTPTMTLAQYIRVGNTVTVSGRFTADPTLTAQTTSFEITLPVASDISNAYEAAGTAVCGNIVSMCADIIGVAGNDTAKIQWKATDVTSQSWSYIFTYQVL